MTAAQQTLKLLGEMPQALSLAPGSAVRLSKKQKSIVEYLAANGTITLQQAVALIGRDIYANACKHVGVTLANMVKRGMIVRLSKGLFALPPKLRSQDMGTHEERLDGRRCNPRSRDAG